MYKKLKFPAEIIFVFSIHLFSLIIEWQYHLIFIKIYLMYNKSDEISFCFNRGRFDPKYRMY